MCAFLFSPLHCSSTVVRTVYVLGLFRVREGSYNRQPSLIDFPLSPSNYFGGFLPPPPSKMSSAVAKREEKKRGGGGSFARRESRFWKVAFLLLNFLDLIFEAARPFHSGVNPIKGSFRPPSPLDMVSSVLARLLSPLSASFPDHCHRPLHQQGES